MRDRDAKLDEAIHETAAILGDVLVRLLFPESPLFSVDSPETESPHVNAG
jgi:hypothetical protein